MNHTKHFLDRRSGLYLKHVEGKGRGLFCVDPIAEGEELETTPAIILNKDDNAAIEETILNNYAFTTGNISKKIKEPLGIKKLSDTSCIVMGIASYCNHDQDHNAEVVWEENDSSLYYVLRAVKDIPAHTEICTTYGDDWFENR
jgi:tRNA-specific adenosine deaminase 3